jgi:hypothetical protein
MPVPTTVSWASSIIGFISFAITLLTLLGVYRDLISTIRYAPSQIPIQLGNLRQEIEAERLLLRRRCREGDRFRVFTGGQGRGGRRRKRTGEVLHLLMRTVDKLWMDFREIERPFLIRSGRRAEEVKRGDFWEDDDIVDEKEKLPGTPKRDGDGKRTNAMGMEEANVGLDERYFRTDLHHRFIWWQSRSGVQRLFEEVQRVQIRRIERDVFECDELVKRVLRRMDGGGGAGSEGSGSGSDDPGPRGGGGVSRRGSGRGSGGKTVYESKEKEFVRVPPARSKAGSVRPVSRAGSVRAVSRAPSVSRVRSISPPRRRSPRLRERDGDTTASPVEQRPSNTARRRAARDSRGPGAAGNYEYEVVRPGRDGTVFIDTSNRPRSRPGLRESQGQSYYRARDVTREQRRDSDGRDGDRNRSRAQYESD